MSRTGMTAGVAPPDATRPPQVRQGQPGAAAAGAARAFVNATVLPMGLPRAGDHAPPWERAAQAILWEGDRIVLVGDDAEVRAEAARRGITPEDLQGRVVLPGFVDAHTHFLHVGVKRTRPDLRGAKSLPEALGRLAAFLRAHPGAHHVIGEGWDESEWMEAPGPRGPDGAPRRPTRDDLDAVVAAAAKDGAGPLDRPVVLRRICGHIAVASSGALPAIRARWDDDAAVDLGTGLLLEAPSLYLNEVLPSTPPELDRAVLEACAEAHRLGVTALGDYSQAPYRAALQRAAAAGRLSVRVASSIYVQQLDAEVEAGFRTGRPALGPEDVAPEGLHARVSPPASPAAAASAARAPQAQGPDATRAGHWGPIPGRDGGDRLAGGTSSWLRDGGLKVFLDGSLGAHTAHLREPYRDSPASGAAHAGDSHAGHDHGDAGPGAGPRGSRIWTDAQLDHFVGTAHGNGIQVHAHAIGDAAIDQGLDAYARLAAHGSLEGHGWPVEALPRLPPEDHGALAASASTAPPGTIPRSLRHRFEHYEIVHDDQVARTVELGIVASSQPNFVGEWSAKGGMYEARLGDRFQVNNRFRAFLEAGVALAFGSDGMPFGPLVGLDSAVRHPDPTQRLTPQEAIWHYTTAAAWAMHWEEDIGSLEPGACADLVILEDQDLAKPPKEWSIRETIAGGLSRWSNVPASHARFPAAGRPES